MFEPYLRAPDFGTGRIDRNLSLQSDGIAGDAIVHDEKSHQLRDAGRWADNIRIILEQHLTGYGINDDRTFVGGIS